MIRKYRIDEITQDKGYLFLMCAYSKTDNLHVMQKAHDVIFLKLNLNHPFPDDCGPVPEMNEGVGEFLRTAGLPDIFDRMREIPEPDRIAAQQSIDDALFIEEVIDPFLETL